MHETISDARCQVSSYCLTATLVDIHPAYNSQTCNCCLHLKSPQRITALAMVMGLSLLVYSLGQRALRLALVQAQQTVLNQLAKPTASPTLRWVFQCFISVHLLTIGGIKQISNLTSERCHILQFLGSSRRKYYLLN